VQSRGNGFLCMGDLGGGGRLSELTGGNFKDGFIGAGVGALLSPMTGALNKGLGLGEAGTGTGWQFLGRTATAGVVGGTATAISGGKFGNGAVTAAFMHVVNHEAPASFRKQPSWHRWAAIYSNMVYDENRATSERSFAKFGLSYGEGDGFAAALYEYQPGKYMLAFRGTEVSRFDDWLADGAQAVGLTTSQYEQGLALARSVTTKLGVDNVIMTGHSLGGGIASAASVATGAKGITFNAAGLSLKYGGGSKNGQVYAHIMKGDPLNRLQNSLPQMPDVYGQRIYHSHSWYRPGGHSISKFLNYSD